MILINDKQQAHEKTWACYNYSFRPLRPRRDVDEGMHMRQHAEVPHEAGAFQTPEGPLVFARVLRVAEEAEVDLVHAAISADEVHDLVGIFTAERRDQVAHDGLDEPFLICGHISEGETRMRLAPFTEAD